MTGMATFSVPVATTGFVTTNGAGAAATMEADSKVRREYSIFMMVIGGGLSKDCKDVYQINCL
jgi:3-oxoacyl-(acyl-carrier-protein) synthase